MASQVKTRFLIISDTHGEQLLHLPRGHFDVAIHCGDLTEESKLDEFRASLQMMLEIDAPLKLVIAGNHDFSLDTPVLKRKLSDNTTSADAELIKKVYGDFGEARALFEIEATKAASLVFLDEGNYAFTLENGASLSVYASPYTPSKDASWGFQYHPEQEHEWAIKPNIDVVITHSPPQGILDYTADRTRAGSPSLFAAIARAKPRLHCFGHIHESWGAKIVGWREKLTEEPSHFTDIDNERSCVVESLAGLRKGKFDSAEVGAGKREKVEAYGRRGFCEVVRKLEGEQTLFVNAAVEGPEEGVQQFAWGLEVGLPRAV